MKYSLLTLLLVLPVRAADPQPLMLAMENQFEQKVDLADHRGSVVILLIGDRKGTNAFRKLSEQPQVQ